MTVDTGRRTAILGCVADQAFDLGNGPEDAPMRRLENLDCSVPPAFRACSLLDECAVESDKDPLQFLLSLLRDGQSLDPLLWEEAHKESQGASPDRYAIETGRMRNALLLAVARSGWRSPLSARHGRGIAVCRSRLTYVAASARVAVADNGRVRVHRIDLAADCGTVADRDRVTAAFESAAAIALYNTLHCGPTLAGATVQRCDLGGFGAPQMADAPVIRVHLVRSEEPPGCVGDPAVAPVMAAIVNGVFAATGYRIRTLPIDPAPLRLDRSVRLSRYRQHDTVDQRDHVAVTAAEHIDGCS